jgi:hypothetical protein
MLVPRATHLAGSIEILHAPDGYIFTSGKSTAYESEELDYILDLLRDEIRGQFMRARPDLLWLHSAAVERERSALLLSGPSGAGKSSLSTMLCERGWRLMSDEVAPLSMESDTVLPFFEQPRRRRYPGRGLENSLVSSLDRDPFPLADEDVCRVAADVCAAIFIAFEDGAEARIERLPPGIAAMEFVRNAINFGDHKGAAVTRAANAAKQLPSFRIVYGRAAEAAHLLDSYEF